MLAAARARLRRLVPEQVPAAVEAGAVLIDIRPEPQRLACGSVPGARIICRNVLEWRCDPRSPSRDPLVSSPTRRLILLCDEGFQSSLAAATLQQLGHGVATDVIGGFQAWRLAGLPSTPTVRTATPSAQRRR